MVWLFPQYLFDSKLFGFNLSDNSSYHFIVSVNLIYKSWHGLSEPCNNSKKSSCSPMKAWEITLKTSRPFPGTSRSIHQELVLKVKMAVHLSLFYPTVTPLSLIAMYWMVIGGTIKGWCWCTKRIPGIILWFYMHLQLEELINFQQYFLPSTVMIKLKSQIFWRIAWQFYMARSLSTSDEQPFFGYSWVFVYNLD